MIYGVKYDVYNTGVSEIALFEGKEAATRYADEIELTKQLYDDDEIGYDEYLDRLDDIMEIVYDVITTDEIQLLQKGAIIVPDVYESPMIINKTALTIY